MNFSLSLIFLIFSALYINTYSASYVPRTGRFEPTEDMLYTSAKKTKNGWICGGVNCPKKRTMSCKTTNILKPNEKLEHDLVVLCMDERNFAFCGITRSSRVIEAEVLEFDEEGNMEYTQQEKITTTQGKTIPHCPTKRRIS